MPACLFAWPVFSHCQYLLDSNSKHGIPLGSPFLPVPRECAFQMEHKCGCPCWPSTLILPGNNRQQDVAASSSAAEVSGAVVLLSLRTVSVFSLRTKHEDNPKKARASNVYQSATGRERALLRDRKRRRRRKKNPNNKLRFSSFHEEYHVLAFFLRATRSIRASKSRAGGEAPPGRTD